MSDPDRIVDETDAGKFSSRSINPYIHPTARNWIHPNALRSRPSLLSRNARPTVIFLSITSNPQAVKPPPGGFEYSRKTNPKTYAAAALPVLENIHTQHITRKTIGSLDDAAATGVAPPGSSSSSGGGGGGGGHGHHNAKNILVCGWRFVWNTHVKRFKARVEELSHNLPSGSVVYCLNRQTSEAFEALLLGEDGAAVGFEKGDEPRSYKNEAFKHGTVTIKHWCGDPTRFGEVEKMFHSLPEGFYFTSAICLGAIPGLDLPSHAQDARILSMLMILRQISTKVKAPVPMHIIAENTEDQT